MALLPASTTLVPGPLVVAGRAVVRGLVSKQWPWAKEGAGGGTNLMSSGHEVLRAVLVGAFWVGVGYGAALVLSGSCSFDA